MRTISPDITIALLDLHLQRVASYTNATAEPNISFFLHGVRLWACWGVFLAKNVPKKPPWDCIFDSDYNSSQTKDKLCPQSPNCSKRSDTENQEIGRHRCDINPNWIQTSSTAITSEQNILSVNRSRVPETAPCTAMAPVYMNVQSWDIFIQDCIMQCGDPTYNRMKSTSRSLWKSQSLHFKSNIDNSQERSTWSPAMFREKKKDISNKFWMPSGP